MKRIFLAFALMAAPAFAQPKQIVVEGVEAPQSAQLAPQLVPPVGHTESVEGVVMTPDNRFAISAGIDHSLRLWELSSGREVRSFQGHSGSVDCVALSPDGTRAVSSGTDQTIRVWDVLTGNQLHQWNHNAAHSLAFLPDGKTVLGGSTSGAVFLFDIESGEETRELMGDDDFKEDWAKSVAVSPDGRLGLSGGGDMIIRLWNLQTGEKVREFKGHEQEIETVAFSPDGALVASSGNRADKSEIAVWNAQSGQKLWLEKFSSCDTIAWSRDGRFVFHDENGFVRAREAKTGALVGGTLSGNHHSGNINNLALSGDGTRLISAGSDHTLRIWSVQNGLAKSVRQLTGATMRVSKMALSPDGRQMLCGLADEWVDGAHSTPARLWDAATGRTVRELPGHYYGVLDAAWSGDGKSILTSGFGGGLHFWNAATGQKTRALEKENVKSESVALNGDGTRALAAVDADNKINTVQLYDTQSGKVLKKFSWPVAKSYSAIRALFFSPDQTKFLAAGEDGVATLWNIESGKVEHEMRCDESIYSAAFSPDGQTIATGSRDAQVRLWSAADGALLHTLTELQYTAASLSFSPDSQTLAGSDTEGHINLWDVKTGEHKNVALGHEYWVTNVVWSKSGQFLLSAGWDNTLRLWNVADGRHLLTYLLLKNGDWLAYTPDGFFDGSPGGIQKVHFTRGLQTYSLDQFYEQFYKPNLLAVVFNGEAPTASQGSVTQAVVAGAPPLVRIVSPQSGAANAEQIEVTVEATEQNNGGVKAIRLYHNGRLVGGPGQLRGIVVEAALESAPNGVKTQKFTVTLASGENNLRAVAYSSTDVESRPAEAKLIFAGTTKKPALRVVCVGLNDYKDATMNLTYARPDAESLAQFFETTANTTGLFSSVSVTKLLDEAATGEAIQNALKQIAESTQPEDVAIIYLAGHGDTAADSAEKDDAPEAAQNFYFLPYEMRQMVMKDRVRQYGLSGKTIDALVAKIPARKIMLIYDACKSGAAIPGASRGAGDEQQALAQLARAQGIYVLAASTSQQYAGEVKSLGHGILTYALLEGLNGKAAGADSIVKVSQLFAYTEDRVPELAKQYRGREQWPVPFTKGQNFPLVLKK